MKQPSLNRIALQTIYIKEVLRFMCIWLQTVVPQGVTTALYFVIFGNLIGERIGEMDGFSCVEFIVPGLILMSVITSSYSNVVSPFYFSKFGHHIEELLVSPVPDWIILAGYICGGVTRGVVVRVIVALVSLLFADVSIHSYGLT